MASNDPIVIVGAGMAGLTAAWYLKKNGRNVRVIEASGHVGGRVHTEFKNGFTLDRGFQVLLTAYPEAQRVLNYEALNLKSFASGAIIFGDKGRTFMGDPLRYPQGALQSAFSWAASLSDKLKVARLTREVKAMSIDDIFALKTQIYTEKYLVEYGFSEKIINHFFRPFFGGIFLERSLDTLHPMFLFVMKMFAEGDAAIPKGGMTEIPQQVASVLDEDEILLHTKIVDYNQHHVIDNTNTKHSFSHLIIATPTLIKQSKPEYQSTTQLYFSSKMKPFKRNAIALNGMMNSTFNNMAIMTNLHQSFAPDGYELISVSVPGVRSFGGMKTEAQVQQEILAYSPRTHDWKLIDKYTINDALPKLNRLRNTLDRKDYMIGENTYLCGDYLLNGSLNAAMKTGRIVAEDIIEQG